MEDIIKKAIENAMKDAEEIQEGYIPLAQALVRYAEKHNFNEAQLYIMLQRVISDMEEADPTLKLAHKLAEPLKEFAKELIDGL